MNLATFFFLLMVVLFFGIIVWTYRPSSKEKGEVISKSIFDEKD